MGALLGAPFRASGFAGALIGLAEDLVAVWGARATASMARLVGASQRTPSDAAVAD
jgi:hypothetical protein